MNEPITVALVGNLEPDHSTENEYRDAYERAGHRVVTCQEGDSQALHGLLAFLRSADPPGFVHWTRTKSLADKWGDAGQWELIATCRRANIPLIGIHLDRWWGLEREHQLTEDPYFKGVDIMFTADGGHQDEWASIGVNHQWLLPAISERWLGLGEWKPEYDCDVVFVGGWVDYGHRAWKHRAELIAFLSKIYGDRFLALPRRGAPRIVGRDLNDVYASAQIVIGDSCLVPYPDGQPMRAYASDRIPESLGRGAILLHPAVEGINAAPGDPFDYMMNWQLGDWGELRQIVDDALACPDEGWYGGSKIAARQYAVDQTAARNTYTHRVNEVVAALTEQGML